MRPSRATHGTPAKYRAGCDCALCALAMSRYSKLLSVDRNRKITRRLDAAPVRAHVQKLLDAKVTYNQIEKATDTQVFSTQVKRLIEGNAEGKEVKFLYKKAHDALLKVTVDDCLKHNRLVDSIGLQRRLQALMVMGRNVDDIAEAMGVSEAAVRAYLNRPQCYWAVVQKADKVYDRLATQPGPRVRIRWNGIRQGWPPALAWDDIDDPKAKPNWSAVRCVCKDCPSSVYLRYLCYTHYREVKARGGFEATPEKFRLCVLRVGVRRVNANDRKSLMHELAVLKGDGYTADEAAMRLGRGVQYVRKLWKDAA